MKQESSRESLVNLLLPLSLILGLVLLLGLNAGQNNQVIESVSPLEKWLKVVVGYLAAGAEIAAAIVISGAIAHQCFHQTYESLTSHRNSLQKSVFRIERLTRCLNQGT